MPSPTSLNLSHPTFVLALCTPASWIISVPQTCEIGPHLRIWALAIFVEGNAFCLGDLAGIAFLSDGKSLLRERSIYSCPSIVTGSYFILAVLGFRLIEKLSGEHKVPMYPSSLSPILTPFLLLTPSYTSITRLL